MSLNGVSLCLCVYSTTTTSSSQLSYIITHSYDHETDEDYEIMQKEETRILNLTKTKNNTSSMSSR
jgi:ssRNA-specific RNase YbeY (16S rRNA maturation enzyme)